MNHNQKFLLLNFCTVMLAIIFLVILRAINGSYIFLAVVCAGMIFQNEYHHRVIMYPLIKKYARMEGEILALDRIKKSFDEVDKKSKQSLRKKK